MRLLALSLSLLWRTVGTFLLLTAPFALLFAVLEVVGIGLQPTNVLSAATHIYAKPSLIYGALAVGLLVFDRVLRVNLHKALWGSKLQLSPGAWSLVSKGVVGLLITLAALNVLVAATASVSTYVGYKLFGALSIFIIGHVVVAHLVRTCRRSEA